LEILLNLGWVALGLVLLYFGAEWLVKGSASVALKFGVSPLVVGLTVVAFGTSAPELLVCLQANFKPGGGDIAIGNIVGSNICNILMVLGVSAMVFPLKIHEQIVKREMNILLVASLVFVAMAYGGFIERIEGILLFVGIVAYVVYSIYDARRTPSTEDDGDLDEVLSPEEIEAAQKGGMKDIAKDLVLIVVGIAALMLGADRLVAGGEQLAIMLSVPKAIIALSLFAFGTSLPELATGIMASWRREGDIVVGNAVGSCIFNLLAVGGITASVWPIKIVNVNMMDFGVMLLTVVLSMILMRTHRSISRVEGGIMLAIYLGYSVYMFVR
jgi:cation:H+ antiporter